jgi:hypothetical protein
MGIDMMKASTKLSMTAVAGLLGVALATGAAYAATTGALSAADAPGQVLKVSGVAPAADHASATALAHANTNAKGLFGTTPAAAKAKGLARATAMSGAANHSSVGQVSRAAAQSTVGQVSRPAAQTLPAYHAVVPSTMTAHPAAPRPMMTPGTSTAPHTMR